MRPQFMRVLLTVLRITAVIARLKRDGTCAETRFRLSPKRTSPFKSAGASVQSTAGSRVVRISGSNAGYTTFRWSVRVLATHSIRQFPLHFPSLRHRVPTGMKRTILNFSGPATLTIYSSGPQIRLSATPNLYSLWI